jgi:hypothetical protein
MRKLGTCAAYAAAVLALGTVPAAAQCTNGLIVNCPPAVSPQGGDVMYLYQLAQNPHSRSISLQALADFFTSTGSTTVSIGLVMPNIFGVGGSPATASGTFNVVLAVEAPNTVFAGTSSGTFSITPSFRALVAADLPDIPCSLQPALTGAVTSNAGSCVTTLSATLSFTCATMPALSGFINTSAGSCTTALSSTVSIAQGGSNASTSNSARVNLNQGYSSPSTGAATITPSCTLSTASTASNVFIVQLQSGIGPYTMANCAPAPATGASFVFIIQQPSSGFSQSISSYGSMYLFPAPYSNLSPPALSHTLSSTDSLYCVAFSTQSMVCTFIPTYS